MSVLRWIRSDAFILILAFVCTSGESAHSGGLPPALATEREGYASADSCTGCHATQAEQWKGSDHGWAMRDATPGNVLGKFDDVIFEEGGVQARFFRKGQDYFVNIEGEDGSPEDFPIRYTFGYYPLQQYLVAFPGGRLQALTVAWDSRSREEGGQRWFSLYPGQRFMPNDPLHWTGRYQNWNAMCADCHSTRLLKGYNEQKDSFASTWQEQSVGCQGCHGPGQTHVDWMQRKRTSGQDTSISGLGLQVDFKSMDGREQVEQCAFCHSRRQTLGVGQLPGHPQLDQSLPVTLGADMYHADGQIRGEVYEYGSFTQSKMYAAGVACTDCHDPHTTKVRQEGNALCLQCHNARPPTSRFSMLKAGDYDSESHHHHPSGSPGAQCVNCHMPATIYMSVDLRRDHAVRIPRPDLNRKTGSPDACTACHQGRSPEWAAGAVENWFGKPRRPAQYGEVFRDVHEGNINALSMLGKVIRDKSNPPIVRATAVQQISKIGAMALPNVAEALKDETAFVRAYAASGFTGMPPTARVKSLLPLISDSALAVRDEAVRALSDLPLAQIPEAQRDLFRFVLADYERRLRGNADLPGGRFNLAELLSRQGNADQAMNEYRQALKLDPYFSPARIKLVTLVNTHHRQDEAERLLREGLSLEKMPVTDHGNLAYMLALLLVEKGSEREALPWMDKAASAIPESPRIRYNQALLLSSMHRRSEAIGVLHEGLKRSPNDPDLLYALIYLYLKQGERTHAVGYIRHMRDVAPDDPRLNGLERYGQ
ncbi:ammonia-forming cytochrome c nitrite reductase subunit c552 [Pseudomonas fluorescens]|uniref:ammonia-forming cytochrome c nitrite reductase subunit c552 n=1 Tax=Pseudomonas fluorescens TaxID=294 RepID=UPI001E500994|nr:cytochrome c3 family protein [Pseudomonas fluorescens]